jgi:hypothetical protein
MKTVIQRLKSRISRRRNITRELEKALANHYSFKSSSIGFATLSQAQVVEVRDAIKNCAANQRLDKELFAMLLEKERSKYDMYFRSSYRPVGCVFNKEV